MTNHRRTQCLSTHLSTFAAGFLVLPTAIDWKYVFANADFNKNRTVYLTIIVVISLYILFMIYSRWQDRKDTEKVLKSKKNKLCSLFLYDILAWCDTFTG